MPLPVIPAIGQTPYGFFGATETTSSPIKFGQITRGLDYRNPTNRMMEITVDIELFNLMSLPERFDVHLKEALVWHLRDVAEAVIDTAQSTLVPGHGYDTGLLKSSLVSRLIEHLMPVGVFYQLLSEQAYYWRWVEFGHWMQNGKFWPGYHYLEGALRVHEASIRRAVREAWADTARKLAAEARAAGAK